MHKILLISPAVNADDKYNKNLRIPSIALSYVAALTPSNYDVKIVEEGVENIDFNTDCDIVGISCMTSTAPRGYEVANEFKKRGKTVVMGGIHPTVLPEEALQYSDTVIVGEAEGAWEDFLKDYEDGHIKKQYRNWQPDLSKYPLPRRDLIKPAILNFTPIVTTRGCPYSCEFCSVTEFFGGKIRHVPIEMVIEDMKKSGSRRFIFLDDNIVGHPKYSKELFTAIIKEFGKKKITWFSQASISFIKDIELMKLAADSGCTALFFGLETVSEENLKHHKKTIQNLDGISDAIKKIKKLGIVFHASLVFGLDHDDEKVFEDTFEFLMKNKISSVSFNVLTPYPGTKVYRDFVEQGRLLTKDWRYYDHCTVTYKPKMMTPEKLIDKYIELKRKFYSFSSILKRFSGNSGHPLFYLSMNMGYIFGIGKEAERIRKFVYSLKTEVNKSSDELNKFNLLNKDKKITA